MPVFRPSPPAELFDPTRNLHWVRKAVAVATFGYMAMAVIVCFSSPPGTYRLQLIEGVVALLCGACYLLARRHPRPAALAVIVVIWGELVYSYYSTGDLEVTSTLVIPVLATATGLVLGMAWTLVSTSLAGPLITGSIYLGRRAHGGGGLGAADIAALVAVQVILFAVALFARAVVLSSRRQYTRAELARRRYMQLFHDSPDGLLEFDEAGRVVEANAAAQRLLGAFPSAPDQPTAAEIFAHAGVQGPVDLAASPLLLQMQRAGGPVRLLDLVARTQPGPEGRTLLILRDVTERRQREARQADLQRMEMVGRLAGGVAHEFNNLLTGIGGNAELLSPHRDPEVRRLVTNIMVGQRRAASLTRQLLSFARLDLSQPEVLDLHEFLAASGAALRQLAGKDRLLLPAVGTPVPVEADRAQLEQALLHLVSNAHDATPADGMVEIRVQLMDQAAARSAGSSLVSVPRQAVLEVIDCGRGISPEVRRRLFEPFFTTKTAEKRHGMGLATALGLIGQNDGALHLESTEGRGTIARIFLPAADPARQTTPPQGGPAAPLGRILLVESESLARASNGRTLERAGYRVTAQPDGFQALKTGRKEGAAFDLLICDLTLPGMSGPELADRLREHLPGLRVLFLCSTYSSAPAGETPDPTREILIKPFPAVQLLERVRLLLAPPPAP